MHNITSEEWRQMLVSLREPRTISELPFPAKAYEFGAVNPHVREWTSRKLGAMIDSGEVELVKEEISNITGSRTKIAFAGRMRLTAKGLQTLRALNEELERAR